MLFVGNSMRHVALFAVALTFSLSCFGATEYPLTGEALSAFFEHPFNFARGATRDEVLRSLGRPVKEARSARQNPHDRTVTDVLYTFQYDSLELRIGAFPGATPPAAGPMLVVLTSAKYKLKHQLQVGSSKKEVQRVLGWPETDFEMSTWSYRGDDAGYLWLQFTFHNDRVSRIKWSQTWD